MSGSERYIKQHPSLVGWLRTIWFVVFHHPIASLVFLMLLLLTLLLLFPHFVAPYDPVFQNISQRLTPPSSEYYFGTDGFGRDIFSRVIYGARVSFLIGFLATAIAGIFGVSVGTISAYFVGKPDLFIQRIIDVLLGFPLLVIVVIIAVAMGPSEKVIIISIALGLFPQITRLSRASSLVIKQSDYADAARVVGSHPLRIIVRHILPNSLPPVLAQIIGYFGVAVVAETAISFIGLGVPPPTPSWGRMIQEGSRHYFEVAPWATVFPGLALSATVFISVILGDKTQNWVRLKTFPGRKVDL